MSGGTANGGARASASGRITSILVAALSSAFGVALLQLTGALTAELRGAGSSEQQSTAVVILNMLAVVFIGIACYVGAVVTINTMATVVAGRLRQLALLRLLGSTGAAQRRALATEGLVSALVGSVIGALVGTGVAIGIVSYAVSVHWMWSGAAYDWLRPVVLLPVAVTVLVGWLASWVGARRVLTVTPLEALGAAVEAGPVRAARRPVRTVVAGVLVALGALLLALGVFEGLKNPDGVLVALVGGLLSFTGVVLSAHLLLPAALRGVGMLMGRTPAARLAALGAIRYPERATRASIGLVIGVTLVTMLGVAEASALQLIAAHSERYPGTLEAVQPVIDGTTAVGGVLVGFSALIAAVGLVNTLSLGVLQRTRELGLLRALGFSAGQLRGMIVAEGAQLTVTATILGVLLGGVYGWCGAQALFGVIAGGLVLPGVPWALLAGIAVAAALLTAVATLGPARRATRVSPVTALAAD